MSGKRLNYNKWDALELSDDSDIEVHPNVDKKSMIRWKQRDIHEKREIRKQKLHHLGLEKVMNATLLIRIRALIDSTKTDGPLFIARTIGELRSKVPDYDGKVFAPGEQPSQDHMVLSLLTQVVNVVEKDNKGEEGRGDRLVAELNVHEGRLVKRQQEVDEETIVEEKEQRKFITSDDLHMGFESKTMISDKPSAAPAPTPATPPPPKATRTKGKRIETTTTIETLNAPSASTSAPATNPDDSPSDGSEDGSDSDVCPLTPAALRFSHLASLDFSAIFSAISHDPSLLTDETTDALLVEAFSVAMKGEDTRARNCVEKGLVGQYCRQLGKDGVALFFRRMTSNDPKSLRMFKDDVATTSARIIARAKVVAAERAESNAAGREQIQLVASDPSTVISFEVPDGPPPETLEVTGEGSEQFDPVLVREFLQKRWEIYDSFPVGLKKALATKSLEGVNKVLGKMAVEEAEEVVEKLQESGILSFEEKGVRDMTGGGEPDASGKVPVRVVPGEEDDVVLD